MSVSTAKIFFPIVSFYNAPEIESRTNRPLFLSERSESERRSQIPVSRGVGPSRGSRQDHRVDGGYLRRIKRQDGRRGEHYLRAGSEPDHFFIGVVGVNFQDGIRRAWNIRLENHRNGTRLSRG